MYSKWILPFADKVILDPKGKDKPLLKTQYNRPEGIVLHFTVSYDIKATADWFNQKSTPVGIHFLVGHKGEIWQLNPMNKMCTHGGAPFTSPITKKHYENVNTAFLGIEFINLGPLNKKGDKFFDYWGKEYKGPVRERYAPEFSEYKYWVPFTKEQEEATWKLVPWLCNRWEIPVDNCIGHYEITRRKQDPLGQYQCGLLPEVRAMILKHLVK